MALGLPTGARGQALALAVTILAVASVWLGVVAPVWGWYDDRSELLRRQSAMARRMASLVDSLPVLQREAARANGSATPDAGDPESHAAIPLLAGATDPLAAAVLQERIEEFAAEAGVHVGSEEIPPGRADGDLRAISVRLTMTAPYRSLVALLLALAQSETPMVVDDLLLRGPPDSPGSEDLPVETSLTVTAYRAAQVGSR